MTPDPRFSVIVPVYGQWDELALLLADLAAQTLDPARFEILVANNEAPRPAPPLALPGNARLIAAPAPGSYAARNAAAAAARGDWLVFTDADCRPAPGWLAALTATAMAHPRDLVAGPVEMRSPAATPNACEIYDIVRGIPQARYVARGYAATANLAAPRAAFDAVGGFAPDRFSGGDAVFCRRAGALGHRLRLAPGAVVGHPARTDWAALTAKARRIKGGQIAAGPLPRRAAWLARSLAPPLRDMAAYLADARHPLRWRAVACAMRLRLWGVELAETARLLAGGAPERR